MTLFVVRGASFELKKGVLHTDYTIQQPGYPMETIHHPYNIRMWLGWPNAATIAKAQSTDLPYQPAGLRTGNGKCTEVRDGYLYAGGSAPSTAGGSVQFALDRLPYDGETVGSTWETFDPPPIEMVNTHPAAISPQYWCIQDGYLYFGAKLGNWYGPDNTESIPSSGTEIWRRPVDDNVSDWTRVHSQGHGFLGGPDFPVLGKTGGGTLVFPTSNESLWSTDAGATWLDGVPPGGAIPGANLARVTPIQFDGKMVYRSGTSVVALDDDLTYTTVAANLPNPGNDQGWQRLATDGTKIISVDAFSGTADGIWQGDLDTVNWPAITPPIPGGVANYGRAVAYDPVRQEWYITSESAFAGNEPAVFGFMPDLSNYTFQIELDPVIGSGGQTADVIHILIEEES